jgi:hypothetical protein
LEGLVRGSGDFGDWLTYTMYGNTGTLGSLVSVVAGILAYIAHVGEGFSLIISIATAVVAELLPVVYYKRDSNIRYSFDGLTLQEQYVTTFYRVSNYTDEINTVTSDIVRRIMK